MVHKLFFKQITFGISLLRFEPAGRDRNATGHQRMVTTVKHDIVCIASTLGSPLPHN